MLRRRFDQKRTSLHLNEDLETLSGSNLEVREIRRQADPHLVAYSDFFPGFDLFQPGIWVFRHTMKVSGSSSLDEMGIRASGGPYEQDVGIA